MKLSKHFSQEEFQCKCSCHTCNVDQGLIEALEAIRLTAGPLHITSGCRCPAHNKNVGSKKTSAHITTNKKKCCGADIKCMTSRKRHAILKAARRLGFTRIGIGKTFIHLDSGDVCRKNLPANVTWVY